MRWVLSRFRLSIWVCSGTRMLPSSSAMINIATAISIRVKPRASRPPLTDEVNAITVVIGRRRNHVCVIVVAAVLSVFEKPGNWGKISGGPVSARVGGRRPRRDQYQVCGTAAYNRGVARGTGGRTQVSNAIARIRYCQRGVST